MTDTVDVTPGPEVPRLGDVELDFPFDEMPKASAKAETVDKPKPAPKKPTGRAPVLRTALQRFYENIGGLTLLFDPVCGQVIIDNAPRTAEAMDELAKQDPNVRRILLKLVETSALGTVVAAHAPIALAIYSHHVLPMMARRQMQMEDAAENREAGPDGAAPEGPATGNGEVATPAGARTLGAGFVSES